MFEINGNTISLTRGDSLSVEVFLYKDDETYIPKSEDKVKFTVKKDFTDAIPLIQKTIFPNDDSEFVLELLPSDTKPLPFGRYKYDMEITEEGGKVYTFVIGDFVITEEVS